MSDDFGDLSAPFEESIRPHLVEKLREQDCGLRASMGDDHGHTSCMWFNYAANEIERLQIEEQDALMVYSEVAVVYDNITWGRISKPNTAAHHVIAEVEEATQRSVDEALGEQGWDDLMSILDRVYPASVFTGESGDIGPQIVVKLREINQLRGEI